MTRFGVRKHLRTLEQGGLVTSRKLGRERLHFLNPVPLRQLHDQWLRKYTEAAEAEAPAHRGNR
jgi:DNA-binding transcriptional ArsR family regulator